jgi:hypothetical protein
MGARFLAYHSSVSSAESRKSWEGSSILALYACNAPEEIVLVDATNEVDENA